MCEAPKVPDHYLFGYRYIMIDVFMDFHFPLASNSLIRWIRIIYAIVDGIPCVQIFYCTGGSDMLLSCQKLLDHTKKRFTCHTDTFITFAMQLSNWYMVMRTQNTIF